MAEEVSGTVTAENASTVSSPTISELRNSDVIAEWTSSKTGGDQDAEWSSLFGEQQVSENALKGEDSSNAETLKGDQPAKEQKSETVIPKSADANIAEDGKGKTPADDKKEAKTVTDKPPAGYVPHAALKEERERRQALAEEIRILKEQLLNVSSGDGAPPLYSAEDLKNFKVLSVTEFDSLAEEDPVAAIKYQSQLRSYENANREKADREKSMRAESDLYRYDVDRSLAKMQEVVPGIFDKASDVNAKLFNFSVEHGVDGDFLAAITSPQTLIMVPGANSKARMVGDYSVGMVKMINELYRFHEANKPETIKQQVEKELREQITAELLAKFKNKSENALRSIGDLPGSMDDISAYTGLITESQYAKMSEAQRERLLGA